MKNIKVYTGSGAYQARDIENFLGVFDFEFERLHESQFINLSANDILIVPGGHISAYLPAWGETGIELIKKFVSAGGAYVGICAGAYIAGGHFKGQAGLNFFPNELEYSVSQQIIDAMDAFGHSWQLITENGPNLSQVKANSVILKDERSRPQAIQINYGQGRVYLFAAHPEGSVIYRQLPQDFSGATFLNRFLRQL